MSPSAPTRLLTRSRTKENRTAAAAAALAAREAAEKIPARPVVPAFLELTNFKKSVHFPALYQLDAKGSGGAMARSAVREVGEVCQDADGDVGAFQVIDLNDRRGIWQQDPRILELLREDPAKHLRAYANGADRRSESPSSAVAEGRLARAGLINLGATCYLNSLLQYLFFNIDFRRALLNASSESVALKALQRVFALMTAGDRSTVDTGEFVTAARIDAVEQADATELSALLFDWLERELGLDNAHGGDNAEGSGSADTEASGVFSRVGGGGFIPALFRGEVCQRLQCKANPEHVFERREHFYELRARLTLEPQQRQEAHWASGPGGGGSSRSLAEAVVVPPVLSPGGDSTEGATAVVGTPVCGGAAADVEATSASAGVRGGKKAAAAAKRKRGPPPPRVLLEHVLEDTAFPEESLDGPNQYICPRCDCKVDARKSTHPARLPPYLHITIERYHYDQRRGERKKLNHVISFPRRLQLRVSAPAPASGGFPVVYECIGFLEHVSDTAQSGHYTATLLEEDAIGTSPASGVAITSVVAQGDAEAAGGSCDVNVPVEPAAKRQRCAGADDAAGTPRGGTWWKLDDDTVSPVTWAPATTVTEGTTSAAAAMAEAALGAPRRIESSGAYLLLYRRADHKPDGGGTTGGLASLPPRFASMVAMENGEFARLRRSYTERANMLHLLVAERRMAIEAFTRALREHRPRGDALGSCDYSLVPTAWLETFLRGEEMAAADAPFPRCCALDDGFGGRSAVSVPPVLYGRALLPTAKATSATTKEGAAAGEGRGQMLLLDPFALWCGKVKLVPTAALDALGGVGGIDSSLFLSADEAMCPKVCRAAWDVFQAWREELRQLSRVLESRTNLADARSLQDQGRANEVTWVSTKVLNMWRRILTSASEGAVGSGAMAIATAVEQQKPQSSTLLQWRTFLSEVSAARWGNGADTGLAAEAEVGEDVSALPKSQQGSGGSADAAPGDVVILAGLLCPHGLLCRSRCGTPTLRTDVEALLVAARKKELAYRALWPDAAVVPRVRSGLPNNRLLAFDAICPECQHMSGSSVTAGAAAAMGNAAASAAPRPCRKIVVRRRYHSGVMRKAGPLSIPADAPVTAAEVSQLVVEQLNFHVARLIVPETETTSGTEMELEAEDVLDGSVNLIVVEKDENAVPPEREAAAFEGCIFRSSSK
eukprot:TRINITY_DN35484_c0_g1_i1.p1 TRINITY_DN35484_c0_g1~~TRINITY_DN35484_c0_g1_i1.p1  ORF type:complete len:1242 (-),score=236.65 TRINITY_DN35484_c0_g1_i1:189-3719(-)